jgi:hypothetical protein
MYNVITVAREHCSGGGAIARSVAERLGWTLLDKNPIAAVARAAQVDVETARRYDESVDSWWHRINRGGLWAACVAAGASPADAQFFDAGQWPASHTRLLRALPLRAVASSSAGGCNAFCRALPMPFMFSFTRRGSSE